MLFILGLALICFLLYLYFFPTIIAYYSNDKNTIWIFYVNLVTGWTCLGWLLALFWALLEQYDIDFIKKIAEKL